MMIASDLGRAGAMILVPALYFLGHLSLLALVIVALVMGTLSLIFDTSYGAALPALVPPEDLAAANGTLEGTASLAAISVPGVAGWMVAVAGAPVVMLLDACSFLFSAFSLSRIPTPDVVVPPTLARSFRVEVKAGIGFVLRHHGLRAIALSFGLFNVFAGAIGALLPLLVVRILNLSPAAYGLVLAGEAAGAIAGATLAPRVIRLLGIWPSITVGRAAACLGMTVIAIGGFVPGYALIALLAGEALYGSGQRLHDVAQVTMRSQITPPELLGRMTGTIRAVIWGGVPVGAILGGLLATVVAVPTVVALAAISSWSAALILLRSAPLRPNTAI
jgi:hypothetical protein